MRYLRSAAAAKVAVNMSMSKEQAAMLLPILSNLAQPSFQAATQEERASQVEVECKYTIAEMFAKKKKNSKATSAQNYLLVSTTV